MTDKITVFSAIVSTEYGPVVHLARDEDALQGDLYGFVCTWWGELPDEDTSPEDYSPEEAIHRYFGSHPYDIVEYAETYI